MPLNRLSKLFVIPEISSPLAYAHLSALKQQVPLLYLIITINSVALAATHYGVAPTPLVIGPVAILAAISIRRGLFWWRLDLPSVPQARYLPMLRQTNRLTATLSPGILLWALAMEHYDPRSSDIHILFFLALTSIGCIFCLTHLRSAALIIAGTVIGPATLVAFHGREPELTAVAVNLLLVGLVIIRILTIQHRDFVDRSRQTEALAELGEQNLRMATTDMLTGLSNRRTFFPALDRMIADSPKQGSSLLLAIIDLDGFKHINDTFGHVTGDRVLAAIAERIGSALPRSALLARIGGDEFAILDRASGVPGICDYLEQAVHAAVGAPIRCGDTYVRVGAAAGVAWWQDGQTSTDLVERADYAMYEAKAVGGNTIMLFSDAHARQMQNKGVVEVALRHADLEAELSLVFQPIVDVDRQRTVAFEALARWDNPQLGRVPPDQFITAAERIGIINDVTRTLLGKLLHLMARWPLEVVSFNLSTADIISTDAVATIIHMVTRSGIDPARLHFEVTETAMLNDFTRARAGLDRIKALGSALSLDDFGTGHSSLSHVHHLPVDKLKVDSSFTREIFTHETARNIVASIIGLAHGLRLDCIVEGVETIEQTILLRGLGCRLMQGYLFHEPMAVENVARYLAEEAVDRHDDEMVDDLAGEAMRASGA